MFWQILVRKLCFYIIFTQNYKHICNYIQAATILNVLYKVKSISICECQSEERSVYTTPAD